MSTSLAYHTQGIIGFQHQSYEFSGGVAIQRLIRKEFRCPRCFHSAVKTYPIRTRRIQGLPYGTKTTFFELDIHRIYCPKCSEVTLRLPLAAFPDGVADCQLVPDQRAVLDDWFREHGFIAALERLAVTCR